MGIISVSLVQSYIAASGIVFFVGIAGGAFLAPISADIQRIVPDELRGRTFAIKEIFINAAMVTPILIVGKLTTFISVRDLMLSLGIGIFVIGIFIAWKSVILNTIPHHTQKNEGNSENNSVLNQENMQREIL